MLWFAKGSASEGSALLGSRLEGGLKLGGAAWDLKVSHCRALYRVYIRAAAA